MPQSNRANMNLHVLDALYELAEEKGGDEHGSVTASYNEIAQRVKRNPRPSLAGVLQTIEKLREADMIEVERDATSRRGPNTYTLKASRPEGLEMVRYRSVNPKRRQARGGKKGEPQAAATNGHRKVDFGIEDLQRNLATMLTRREQLEAEIGEIDEILRSVYTATARRR